MNGKLMTSGGNNFQPFFADLVFPRACLVCGSNGDFLCQLCRNKIRVQPVDLCPICKREDCRSHISAINHLWTLTDYHELGVNSLITNIKYNYLTGLLEEFWREKIKDFCFKQSAAVKDKLIIPIPLHHQKYLRRGFNQSELIAKIIKEYSSCQINNRLLHRIKNNPPQVEQSGVARLKNTHNIFKVNYRELADCWGREIVLVDDVYTTGATALEAAGELRRSGFKKIDCLVLAVSRI